MIEIYGSPQSSAGRCYWLLEELGVPYKRVPINMREKEHKSEKFLQLNPNGKVPVLTDGDFIIWESLAINNYLAEKHESVLQGRTAETRSLIAQWSLWAMLEVQRPMIDIFIQKIFVPEDRRDLALVAASEKALPGVLIILEKHLSENSFMVESRFTLADINVASIINIAAEIKYDLSAYKNITNWLGRCKDRTSYQKLAAMGR